MPNRQQQDPDVAATPEIGSTPASDDAQARAEIELRAYYRYCDRGCAPGFELEDWLAAERDLQEQSAAKPATDR